MVSPEMLRRFLFFSGVIDSDLKEIAMAAEEVVFEKDSIILEEKKPADFLYVLVTGNVDLTYISEEEYHPKSRKEFYIGNINPGEVFGISSLVHPYNLNSTAYATQECSTIKIDAKKLRAIMESDPNLGYILMTQLSKSLKERLTSTRVQLAAAWAEKSG